MLCLLIVAVLMFSTFVVTASAASMGLAVAKVELIVTHPLDGNKPNTDVNDVKVKLISPTGMEQNSAYYKVQRIDVLDWEEPTKTNFEYEEDKEYIVYVEIATVSSSTMDVYFNSIPTKSECKINGIQADGVQMKSNSDNKVMIVNTTLTANKVEDFLCFAQMAPGITAAEENSHVTDLGEIEYGTYTMFGFDTYPLTQGQQKLGYTVQPKIYVNYGGGTLVTRKTGDPFNLMMYVDQLLGRGSNPFTYNWSVWFMPELYQNGEYVGGIGHIYNLKITPAVISNVVLRAPTPTVGSAPDLDLGNVSVGGEGYEITDIEWTDPEGIILPDQSLFETGKTYACVLQVEPMDGYTFPENRKDFSGKINGIDGEIAVVYDQNRAYVTVYYTMTQYGDVDGDGNVKAADALMILKAVVGKTTLTAAQITAGDVDGDGQIKAADALNILKKVVGKIDKFPVEQ